MADTMDDDEDFSLYPGASSRLSSLFPVQRPDENDVNQSLTYVPPKQPKKIDAQQQNAKEAKCFHAVAAYTHKLEGGKYTSQGKCGAAIIGSTESSTFTLFLYKGKRQPVTTCTIQQNFQFAVEQNNYAKFPDDKGEQWSIWFSSEDELGNFAKQVALAKTNSCGQNFSTLIVQDLVAGDGVSAEMGDSLEVSFTGYLLKDFGFGEVFDNSANEGRRMFVELGKSSVIECWNEALIGAKKGLRRLIIVPSKLGYSAGNSPSSVSPNDVLIFDVLIHKVRRSQEHSQSPSSTKSRVEKKPDVPPRTASVSYDDSIRSRGASISEQLTQSPRKDNAQIISRMAKIGGTHLLGAMPTSGPVPTVQNSSESEPEKENEPVEPRPRKQSGTSPKHVPTVQKKIEQEESDFSQPRRSISSPIATVPATSLGGPIPYIASQMSSEMVQYMNQPFVHPQLHPTLMPSVMPNLMENQLPLLVSETRTQNMETRLSLAKISEKVDSAIQKIDDIRLNQGSFRTQAQLPYMESAVLAQNIERIMQENIQLKQDIEVKNSKIQEQNEKIYDILQRNQRFFEESNSFLEQRTDSMLSSSTHFQNKIQTLEQEKLKLSSGLEESLSKGKELHSQVNALQKKLVDTEEKLTALEEECKELKKIEGSASSKREECDALVKLLEEKVENSEQHNEKLMLQLTEVKEKLVAAEEIMEQFRLKTVELQENVESRINEAFEKDQEIKKLKVDLQKSLLLKKKYDTLLENTRLRKNQYELQISELLSELKTAKTKSVASATTSDFSSEIRKVMNVLYKSLQNEFAAAQTYMGSDVLDVCLTVIRNTTFAVLERGQRTGRSSSKESVTSEKDNVKPVMSSSLSSGDQADLIKQEANEIPVENLPASAREVLAQNTPSSTEEILAEGPSTSAKEILTESPSTSAKEILIESPPFSTKEILAESLPSSAKEIHAESPPSSAKEILAESPPSSAKEILAESPPSSAKEIFAESPPSSAGGIPAPKTKTVHKPEPHLPSEPLSETKKANFIS